MSGDSQNSPRAGRKTAIAITALLTSPTIEHAAEVVGTSVASLRRWRSRPEFAREMCRSQEEILRGIVNELRVAGTVAATTLRAICSDEKAGAPARVRAANSIINLLMRAHQVEVVEARLVALEAKMEAKRRERGRQREWPA
jgi:hypothetical protein